MKFLIILCLLVLYVDWSQAVTCHSCGYVAGVSSTQGCVNPFDASDIFVTTETCSGTCYKTVVEVNSEVASVARGCSIACSQGCVSLFGISTCTDCCSEEYCNGSGAVTLNIALCVAGLLTFLALVWQ